MNLKFCVSNMVNNYYIISVKKEGSKDWFYFEEDDFNSQNHPDFLKEKIMEKSLKSGQQTIKLNLKQNEIVYYYNEKKEKFWFNGIYLKDSR